MYSPLSAYARIFKYARTHACIHMRTHIRMYAPSSPISMHTRTHFRMYACLSAYARMFKYARTHACLLVCIHARALRRTRYALRFAGTRYY